MDNQALTPTSYKDFATVGENQTNESKSSLDDEQKALAYLSNLKGWKILKAFIERIDGDLDAMVTKTVEMGASYEEIGRKTAVREVTRNVTRRIIERVESARGDK